ncbi:hypothetical protein ACRTAL_002377 [Clostridium perfringens]
MNVYKLSMMFEEEGLEDGVGWDNEYLTNPKIYTKEEFVDICNKAKEICRNKYGEVLNYTMVKVLKEEFGFLGLNILATYDYEEEY